MPGNFLQCYTIGYGTMPVTAFIAALQRSGIDTVIDIRTTPYSRFRPEYNRENLEKILAKNHFSYRYMGDTLGGRYTDPALLMPDGSVDYTKVRDTARFGDGIARLIEMISSGMSVVLMCAEKDPGRCHRSLLVAPALEEHGLDVVHIRQPPGE